MRGRERGDRVLYVYNKAESLYCYTAEQCAFMKAEVHFGDVKDVRGNDPAKRGIEEIFESVADLYGLSALEARKAILGAEQEVGAGLSAIVGEGTTEAPTGTSAGTRRLRSSSPPIEVVKPEKRRKKGGAPQEKGQELIDREREKSAEKEASSESAALLMGRHRGGKRDVKEAATKTQVGHGEEKEHNERERANRGDGRGEDIDPSIMKEVMEVFERDESSVASQAGGPVLPKQQQKLPMATGEEKRLKGAVAVMQSGHGEGSASMTAQVIKGKATDKSRAKEAERRWSCPNVEPTERILNTRCGLGGRV
ncbi:hypothetical protein Dimus_022877 [Dionaea muscipula]